MNLGSAARIGANTNLATAVDLNTATLRGANLAFANPNLGGTRLAGKDLTGTDLTGADLRQAILNRAILVGAILTGADLSFADVDRADFTDALLVGAILAGISDQHLARATWNGADLTAQNLSGRNLSAINLTNANLTDVQFVNTDLTFARLAGATLAGADLTGAKLGGIPNADLVAVRSWQGADLSGQNLTGRNLTGINFAGAILRDANLALVNFTNADLTGAVLPIGNNLNGITWKQTTCPAGNKTDTGCSGIVPIETGGLFADRDAGLWPNGVPVPDTGNRDPWERLLTNYNDVRRSYDDGVILRIVNNSTDPVNLGVVDSESGAEVALPVGKALWLGGSYFAEGTVNESLITWLKSPVGGSGRLILDDLFEAPLLALAKVAYYELNEQADYNVGDERTVTLNARDGGGGQPVTLVLTIKRLEDPEDWMSQTEQNSLGPKDDVIGDWAVFTVSIDKMGLTRSV